MATQVSKTQLLVILAASLENQLLYIPVMNKENESTLKI